MHQYGQTQFEMNLAAYPRGKKHAESDIIEFILNKEKPKYRKAEYVRAVCNIIPHKTDNYRTRLTAGGNIIDY